MTATDRSIRTVEELRQHKVLYAVRDNKVLKLEEIKIETHSTGSNTWVILKSKGEKRVGLTFFNIGDPNHYKDHIFANYWWAYAYLLALRKNKC